VAPEVLSAATGHAIVPMSVDKFTWAEMRRFPIVTIQPGTEFRVRLPVAKAIASGRPSGDAIPVWRLRRDILDRAGAAGRRGQRNWKDFAPMRFVVKTTAKGTLR
jgi:hypothetical protein